MQKKRDNTKMKACTLMAILLALFSMAAAFDHSHSDWDNYLGKYVKNGVVNYSGIVKNPLPLRNYLNELATVTRKEFNGWNKNQQLAFTINLYNAATVKLIADNYPVSSIRKIGGIFKGPWKQPVVGIFGSKWTLDQLEHKFIRPRFRNPYIHVALVCAAKGCPILQTYSYTAEELNNQLEQAMSQFMGSTSKNRWDAKTNTLHLSPIFKWYKDDFGDVTAFVRKYIPGISQNPEIVYTDYDWALNGS